MKPLLQTPIRAVAVLASVLVSFAIAQVSSAQPATVPPGAAAAPAVAPAPRSGGRPDQAIERITTEDAGSRIDELRVGGETKNITVQPKNGGGAPAYEVRPENAQTTGPASSSGTTTGSRVWNIFKF